MKQVISMSTLGSNGRFGNQLFQYAFLNIYAKRYDLRIETPSWVGQYLFGHNDPRISTKLYEVREENHDFLEDLVSESKDSLKNVDIWGFFLYHTKYYLPYKDYFCSLFRPLPYIETKLSESFSQVIPPTRNLIGLHLRRGDFRQWQWKGDYFIAPSKWYKEWLSGLWETLDDPVLFIASDELDSVLPDFKEYNPITTKDISTVLPGAEFYPDFFFLSRCNILATSNSTFSFAASLLNDKGKFFFRPHYKTRKLIPFDPWSSEPLLTSLESNIHIQIHRKMQEAHLRTFEKAQKVKSKLIAHYFSQ